MKECRLGGASIVDFCTVTNKQVQLYLSSDAGDLDWIRLGQLELLGTSTNEPTRQKMNRLRFLVFANLLLVLSQPNLLAKEPTTLVADDANVENKGEQLQFADLPYEITSFGAAQVDGKAYVYGGHTGGAHSYSTEEQSNELLSLDLNDKNAKWQVAAKGDRLQGLAAVPYKSNVILIGGFTAKNEAGEEHDLHSQTRVRLYDTNAGTWTDLPPLPEGRSSHDAAILDGTIYVVGGWTMAGEKDTTWHTTALKLNLEDPKPSWEELKQPPFERRALAVVAHKNRIFVIGGMNHRGGPTKEVQIYNPKNDSWSKGPALIGEGMMTGFGAAGWSVDGQLIVSTYEGDILRLSESGDSWSKVGKSAESRFFHRLIPINQKQLVAVGGANMESGKFLNLEVLPIQ